MEKKKNAVQSRRDWLKAAGALGLGTSVLSVSEAKNIAKDNPPAGPAGVIGETTESGPRVLPLDHEPQLFVDDYLLDNYWGVNFKTEAVIRVFHQPTKHTAGPVVSGEGGYVNVVHDKASGVFRMWYQDFWIQSTDPFKYTYAIAYAESDDGVTWRLPRIGKYSFKDTLDNNIVFRGENGTAAACPFILDLPDDQKRGYKFVMLCTTAPKGMHLIGSHDGIHWEHADRVRITPGYGPDTQSSILWDPGLKEWVCFTRATNIFGGEIGMRRRVARLAHTDLWSEWPVYPENVLIPDEVDAKKTFWKFYGMPTRYYAGIYWGFLWPFSPVTNAIYTELAFSRDGRNFMRSAERKPLIDMGAKNTWDHGMVLGSPSWVEVGDEWWLYYFGTDKDHSPESTKSTTPGIGLARLRKDGFASLRIPAGGGTIVTRMLRWPGGQLHVNANTQGLTVRITDYDRQPVAGMDSEPSLPVKGDSIRHVVTWKNGDISKLKGKAIRLEFFMEGSGDVYSFQAASADKG